MSDRDLVIGILQKLFEGGDISVDQHKRFYESVRAFLVCATEYLLKWCPLNDELLLHVVWVGFEGRLEKTFSSVEYIVCRFHSLFTDLNMDRLHEQYLSYQLLLDEDVPNSVKESTGVSSGQPYRVDVLWAHLKDARNNRIRI